MANKIIILFVLAMWGLSKVKAELETIGEVAAEKPQQKVAEKQSATQQNKNRRENQIKQFYSQQLLEAQSHSEERIKQFELAKKEELKKKAVLYYNRTANLPAGYFRDETGLVLPIADAMETETAIEKYKKEEAAELEKVKSQIQEQEKRSLAKLVKLIDQPKTTTPAKEQGTKERVITGIVYSKDRPMAMLGKTIIRKGDKINDVAVVDITSRSVVFERNGQQWTQNLQQKAAERWK